MATIKITSRSQLERLKQAAFDRSVSILVKQAEFTCTKRNPKHGSSSSDLPCALVADVPPKWTLYEFGAQSAQFSRSFYRLTKDVDGGVVTIDMDKNCDPHITMDYREFLIDRADQAFAKLPPDVMVLATNCSSNSMLSVPHHRRNEEPVNGAPDSLHAARAIEFANSSADFLVRLIVKGLEYNKLMLVVFETPANFLQQQPVYYDKLRHALGLKEARFCRCRLYGTPIRKDTIILNNLAMWRVNRLSYEERMCTSRHRCAGVGDKRKHDIICIGAAAQASAQLETALCDDVAMACFRELVFNDQLAY
jgi:hypothetical protein